MSEDEQDDRTPEEIHRDAAKEFAETTAMLFVHFGCENYVTFDVQVPTIGLCTLTVQRAAGLTPLQKMQQLQDELAQAKEAARTRARETEETMRRWAAIAVGVERIVEFDTGTAEEKLAKIKQTLVAGGQVKR